MTINEYSKIADILHKRLVSKYPEISSEKMYEIINDVMKRFDVKSMDYDNSLNEELVCMVKERFIPRRNTRFRVARRIGNRIGRNNETQIYC